MTEIILQVNGESVTCTAQTPLLEFLAQRQFNPKLIAIEYNGEILHRQFWDKTTMQAGDRLEIVTIVGGG
ncbi:MAG: sulfur carrier protein ThiS [Spirulinaceae cyanobacterium]